MPAGTVDNLLKPESKDKLISILSYHVVAGSIKSTGLKDGLKVKTVLGEELAVTIKDGKVILTMQP